MDDLLALFDEIPPEEVQEDASSVSEGRNLDGDDDDNDDGGSPRRRPAANKSSSKHEKAKEEDSAQKRLASISNNVDERVGFRITNRLVSSMDLLDMLTTNPYHSPAFLAAMSLKQLNTLLASPAQIIDTATVAGKTNAMTVGIVFSNSGTRIASSGNAFTILTIGTLRSGPCATVMLFGSVYGKFCKKLTSGTAIAVMYPRLVPPKADYVGDTSITFSVNDEQQIVMLGTALDFGFCQAKIRGKNEKGAWVSDARRCRTYVDKRVCLYCQKHRSQATGQQKQAVMAQSRMQDLRQQGAMLQAQSNEQIRKGKIMTMPKFHISQQQQLLQPSRFSNTRGSLEPFGTGPRQQQSSASASRNSLLNPSNGQQLRQVQPAGQKGLSSTNGILYPRLQTAKSVVQTTTRPSSGGSVKNNPYASRSTAPRNVVTPLENRRPATSTTVVNKDVNISSLISTGKRKKEKGGSSTGSKKTRKINTDTAGFDGTVAIPKPKGRIAPTSVPQFSGSQGNTVPGQRHEKDQSSIMEKQRAIAEKLQQRSKAMAAKKDQRSQEPGAGDGVGWCAPINDAERERLRNVKSRFATEADAEKLAAASHKVAELAKEEERKTNKQTNKKNSSSKDNNSKHIQKVWRCLTCQHLYNYHPQRCFNLRHDVAVERELSETSSKEQKRMASNNKADGLKLGSGIEWSWNRFN